MGVSRDGFRKNSHSTMPGVCRHRFEGKSDLYGRDESAGFVELGMSHSGDAKRRTPDGLKISPNANCTSEVWSVRTIPE